MPEILGTTVRYLLLVAWLEGAREGRKSSTDGIKSKDSQLTSE